LLLTAQSPSLRQSIVRYHVHCPVEHIKFLKGIIVRSHLYWGGILEFVFTLDGSKNFNDGGVQISEKPFKISRMFMDQPLFIIRWVLVLVKGIIMLGRSLQLTLLIKIKRFVS